MRLSSGRPSSEPGPLWPGRIGVGLVVAALYATESLFQPGVFDRYTLRAVVDAFAGRFDECASVALAMTLVVGLVERRPPRRDWAYTGALVAAAFVGSAIGLSVWGGVVFGRRLPDAAGYLASEAIRFWVIGVFVALVDGLRRRARHARAAEREALAARAAIEAQTDLATLRLLEAQIEPHFLFNTIANLRRTWRVDPLLGERMHRNVLVYLESTLPQLRSPLATLGDEAALVRAYLELFAIRLGPRLRFSIEIPTALAGHDFPRLVLLTLVENAIKHGIVPAGDGGRIDIAATTDDDQLVVGVVDDGVGFGAAPTGGAGIGLANIRARLLTGYGRAARLDVVSGAAAGVEATVRLPLARSPDLAASRHAFRVDPRAGSTGQAASFARVGPA